jgi:hypothetical protein
MCRKGLNRRPDFAVTLAIRRVVRHKRFHRHAFLSKTTRDEALRRRQCLRFAATRLNFAARLGPIRAPLGHAPQALQPTPIFVSIGSERLGFAASGTP